MPDPLTGELTGQPLLDALLEEPSSDLIAQADQVVDVPRIGQLEQRS